MQKRKLKTNQLASSNAVLLLLHQSSQLLHTQVDYCCIHCISWISITNWCNLYMSLQCYWCKFTTE
ncbi:hypothetical protein T05_12054 [Trichinella murrelli]|uniref:Uncharacterized protein n=1 Tax=Trichinella murrelli TaxID=144512 RepID=A0A0V0TTI0_9BILA|nr:hypothetical protein T05_12054 [Trichinella murrelli]